ncbi:MAG: hypothetical protein MK213_03245 [Planctomycetes bacterium]|nr:hypothetical protein [Planctomycetota bacterium]
MTLVQGFLSPCRPQLLLTPSANPGWSRLANSFERARKDLEASGAERLLLFSTQWPSIIGHQMQADPRPQWNFVDQDFHELGTIDYDLVVDAAFSELYCKRAQARGLTARTVAYKGFPIDGGSLVALSLLNSGNRIPASIVSCNLYADRSESIILGKAARDAIEESGVPTAVVAVSALSNRMWTHWLSPEEDRIHSAKDDEWNRKFLSLLEEGRLEDVSQLAREFSHQAHGDAGMKAFWWWAGVMGETNDFAGHLYGYEPVWGTGQALLGLTPGAQGSETLEYDEDSAEQYKGDRGVLTS